MARSRAALPAASACALLLPGTEAGAQQRFPARPVIYIAPFGPGSGNDVIARIVQEPGFKAKMNQLGSDTVGSTPEEYDAFNKAEIARWIKVARDGGIKPE